MNESLRSSISCDMDDDDYPIPPGSSSGFSRRPAAGEELMELLWQNGTVVAQRCSGGDAVAIRSSCEEQQQHSFMQEDETASWLQYALDESTFDRDSYVDLFNSPPPPPKPITTIAPPRSVVEIRPPPSQDPKSPPRLHNFMPFSRIDPVRNSSETTARGSAMVESNETPVVGTEDCSTQVNTESVYASARGAQTPVPDRESVAVTRQVSMTSSSGGSGASFSTSVEPSPPPPQKVETEEEEEEAAAADDRKRKGREDDDGECQSEETEFEAGKEAKKKARGVKRSRSAEIHNLSERKRRDRINEKMKALQELIPASNKTDKVSLLDDAIEYFKSLQLQVQMMSNMGCGMVPMMYPGMQQYMHAMSMGMGMSRPMVPYPSLLPGPTMPHPTAAAAHMGRPIFPMPAPFHQPQVPVPDPSRIQASNLTDPHDPRILNVVDPYQQYLGLQQAQLPLSQDQAVGQSSATKPSTSKENSKRK